MTEVKEVHQVEEVDGGYCHTLVRTRKGKVFALGCGDDGQRGDGLDTTNDEETARSVVNQVKIPTRASQVAAGANHSVVLGEDGVAYTFGANDVGQCGVYQETHCKGEAVLSPRPVVLPDSLDEKIVHVSAGYAHTVLTTQSGDVYVFGQNDNGQLGLGAEEDFDKGDDPIPQSMPVKVNLPE